MTPLQTAGNSSKGSTTKTCDTTLTDVTNRNLLTGEAMIEDIYKKGSETLAHQFDGTRHRLVLCCNSAQQVGEWVDQNDTATVGEHRAFFWSGLEGGTLYKAGQRAT